MKIIGELFFGVQTEPDDFLSAQDALAMSVDGWPLGSAGQWNDLDENNTLYFVVEYNGTINDSNLAVGFDSDAVRIFGEGYRPPEFEAKINQGQINSIVLKRPGEGYYESRPSTTDIYLIGDDGNSSLLDPLGTEINPVYAPNNTFINGSGFRRNTDPQDRKNDAFHVHNGINLHSDPKIGDLGGLHLLLFLLIGEMKTLKGMLGLKV